MEAECAMLQKLTHLEICWTRLDLLSAMNKHSQAAFAIDTQRTC